MNLTDHDKDAIRQWMLDSLDGKAILEDGDLDCVEYTVSMGEPMDGVREAIFDYGYSLMKD